MKLTFEQKKQRCFFRSEFDVRTLDRPSQQCYKLNYFCQTCAQPLRPLFSSVGLLFARYVLQFGSCQLHTTVTIYIQNIGEREKRIFFPYFFSSVSLKSFFLFRTHSMESALACKSQQENKRVEKSGIQHRKKRRKQQE